MSLKEFIENRQKARISESPLLVQEEIMLNEVKFNEKKLEKIAQLYGKIMGKQMKGQFKRIGIEDFKRKRGTGRGIRTMNDAGEQLRFNWDSNLSKKGLFELTSIDYWRKGDLDFAKPYRRIELSKQDNVIQVLAKIVDALQTGQIAEAEEIIDVANMLFEARTTKEVAQWAKENDMNPNYVSPSKRENLKKAAAKAGLGEALAVFLGEEETNTFDTELKNSSKALKEVLYSDPETVFDDIEDLLTLIASGDWNSLLILGDPGIGKTLTNNNNYYNIAIAA